MNKVKEMHLKLEKMRETASKANQKAKRPPTVEVLFDLAARSMEYDINKLYIVSVY